MKSKQSEHSISFMNKELAESVHRYAVKLGLKLGLREKKHTRKQVGLQSSVI